MHDVLALSVGGWEKKSARDIKTVNLFARRNSDANGGSVMASHAWITRNGGWPQGQLVNGNISRFPEILRISCARLHALNASFHHTDFIIVGVDAGSPRPLDPPSLSLRREHPRLVDKPAFYPDSVRDDLDLELPVRGGRQTGEYVFKVRERNDQRRLLSITRRRVRVFNVRSIPRQKNPRSISAPGIGRKAATGSEFRKQMRAAAGSGASGCRPRPSGCPRLP